MHILKASKDTQHFKKDKLYRVDMIHEGQAFIEECTVSGVNARKETIIITTDNLLTYIQNKSLQKG